MDQKLEIILAIFLALNLTAFLLMFFDKQKSKKVGAERISEGMLFFMATAFGSVGVWAGMYAFRHKTQKWYFLLGIPMLVVQNSALLYVLYKEILVN